MFQDFSSLTHTHKTLCILIHHFHFLHFYPFIHTHTYRPKTMSFTFDLLMMYHLVRVSRLFIPHTYTQTLYILIHHFHFLHFYSFIHTHTHTHTPIALRAIPCQIHIDQKQCHLPSIFQWHLSSSNIVVSSNLGRYELATVKEGNLNFILSDNGNYDFHVKVGRCGFVGFVNNVINCGC